MKAKKSTATTPTDRLLALANELSKVLRLTARNRWVEDRGGSPPDDATLDAFLDDDLAGGTSIFEAFAAEHSSLPTPARALVLSWVTARRGVFRLDDATPDTRVVTDLVSDLTYTLHHLGGRRAMMRVPTRGHVVGRIVPVGGLWAFSGAPTPAPGDAEELLGLSAYLAATDPRLYYANPLHLAGARARLARQHEAFVEHFGALDVVLPGAAAEETIAAWVRAKLGGGASWAATPFDEAWVSLAALGVLHDPLVGLCFVPDYDRLRDMVAGQAPITRDSLQALADSGLFADDDDHLYAWRVLAERHPERVEEALRVHLGDPEFSWARDQAKALRHLFPRTARRGRVPWFVPLAPERKAAAQRWHDRSDAGSA